MTFHIISIFPEIFGSYLDASLIGKARAEGTIDVRLINPRDFTNDPHHAVDDKPYGGGPGMVMMVEPIYRAVQSVKRKARQAHVILLSPRGKELTQEKVRELKDKKDIILICGRYEGVDERVAEHIADEVISIGPYVVSGGELPALVVLEAVSRYVPDVIGKEESREDVKGSYPAYTRPEAFTAGDGTWSVPDVLLSGNHADVAAWREKRRFDFTK